MLWYIHNSDTVKTAVLLHLGDDDDTIISISNEYDIDDLDNISINEEELEMDSLCFHASVCFHTLVTNPNNVLDLPDDDGNLPDDDDDVSETDDDKFNTANLPSLNAILNTVSINQRKPLPWVQEMTDKFTAIEIITTSDIL